MELVTPPPLDPCDRVAVVAPCATAEGGTYPDHLVELGVERLRESFDLEAEVYPSVERDGEWRYDNPAGRARELERAFRDPDVAGVVAVVGGNDQIRILRHLDPDVVRDNPTRFYGTSDNTSFAAFLREQGVVSFYGGTLFTDVAEPGGINDYTREYLRRAFFEDVLGEVREAERFSDQDLDWNDPENLERDLAYEPSEGRRWDGEGRVEGRTWGGCLEVLATQFLADRWIPAETAGSVLLLETSEELPSAAGVRRVLTGLGERGALDVGAVLVGRAKARSFREERSVEERAAYRERQREAVADVVGRYNDDAIVVTDVEFGHTKPVAPVPVGGRCVVDADERTLRFP
jgi:muramoyltetrapeptide carboxypeptidase LdcA involved in peptidoglycan recycling